MESIKLASNWGEAMASALDMELHYATPAKKQVFSTTAKRPANSPDYLVTWGLNLNMDRPKWLKMLAVMQ